MTAYLTRSILLVVCVVVMGTCQTVQERLRWCGQLARRSAIGRM